MRFFCSAVSSPLDPSWEEVGVVVEVGDVATPALFLLLALTGPSQSHTSSSESSKIEAISASKSQLNRTHEEKRGRKKNTDETRRRSRGFQPQQKVKKILSINFRNTNVKGEKNIFY
jgi:hypothetical protein